MQLHIQGRHLQVTDALQHYTMRRVEFALDRLAHRIKEVVVQLAHVHGPRGAEDKRCQVHVLLSSGGSLILEGRDTSAYRAIDRTVGRAKRMVKDEIKRRRDRRRRVRSRTGRVESRRTFPQ